MRVDGRGGDGGSGAKESTVQPAIVAIYNQKGGAGKSVSTANLARAMASDAVGRRVLVLELDKQGNCSLMLGVDPSDYENPMTGVFEGRPLRDCVVVVEDRLHLVPADPQLPDVVNSLHSQRRREEVLARQLRGELDDYEIVLVDMPPGQDLLAVNGLVLATHVVVPVRMTDANAVNGLVDLQDFLAQLAALDWERPIALVLRIDCKAFDQQLPGVERGGARDGVERVAAYDAAYDVGRAVGDDRADDRVVAAELGAGGRLPALCA